MKKILAVAAVLSAVCPAAFAQDGRDPLLTRPGLEVGAQAAHYHYEEPDVAKLIGLRAGGVGAFTLTQGGAFFKADGRLSLGSLNYQGSGTRSNIPDLIFEVRVVAGTDLQAGEGVVLSPYAGLGYRYLYNDFRGYTRSGGILYVGYRRYSNYLYAPVGFTMRIRVGDGWVLAPTLEADVFLRGMQVSKASDTNLGYIDVTNTQDKGRGHRVYLMLEKDHLAIGAWTHYWHIGDSDLQFGGVVQGVPRFLHEPENYTREIGVEVRYRF